MILFFSLFFIVVQVQLSLFFPHHSPCPTHPHLLPSILPPFGFVHVSFINVPRSNIFTDMSPRARTVKERIKKWNFIKMKSFCMAKGNISKMNREPTVWENIFANDTLDKGLISKRCKELTQLHSRKTNNPSFKKWAKDLNRTFSKEDIQRAQRHMKKLERMRLFKVKEWLPRCLKEMLKFVFGDKKIKQIET